MFILVKLFSCLKWRLFKNNKLKRALHVFYAEDVQMPPTAAKLIGNEEMALVSLGRIQFKQTQALMQEMQVVIVYWNMLVSGDVRALFTQEVKWVYLKFRGIMLELHIKNHLLSLHVLAHLSLPSMDAELNSCGHDFGFHI